MAHIAVSDVTDGIKESLIAGGTENFTVIVKNANGGQNSNPANYCATERCGNTNICSYIYGYCADC